MPWKECRLAMSGLHAVRVVADEVVVDATPLQLEHGVAVRAPLGRAQRRHVLADANVGARTRRVLGERLPARSLLGRVQDNVVLKQEAAPVGDPAREAVVARVWTAS